MSMFTLRSPVVLALLVLTTMTQARPSYAAPTPAGRVASMAGSAGPSQPPVAALQANGMPSSGYHTLGAIPNLSAPRPPAMTYLVHGEPPALDALSARIQRERQWPVHVAKHLETVNLALG